MGYSTPCATYEGKYLTLTKLIYYNLFLHYISVRSTVLRCKYINIKGIFNFISLGLKIVLFQQRIEIQEISDFCVCIFVISFNIKGLSYKIYENDFFRKRIEILSII